MAQKTLKQLLSSSESREQVDLNLDQATFRAPNVAAGQYSVQVQQTLRADQTQAGQLANALGRYAGPIARQYQGIENQRQEEYAQVAGLLTPEQAKAVAAGNIEPFREQFKQTSDKLDSAQRKKFLKFVENPNNYIRASRVLGQKVASFVETDIIENNDSIIRDERGIPTQLQELSQTIASGEDYELTGYALEGFMEKFNNIAERYTPKLIEAQDAYKEEQYIANGIDSLAQTAKNGDHESFVAEFNETFKGYTPAEQAEHLAAAVSLVTSMDTLQAKGLVSYLEDNLQLGNAAALTEGTMNTLTEAIEQKDMVDNNRLVTQQAEFKKQSDESIKMATLQLQKGDQLDSFSITLGDGEPLEVNVEGVTDIKGLYNRVAETVYSSKLASDADKALYSIEYIKAAEDIAINEEARYDKVGVNSAADQFKKALGVALSGQNLYGLDAVSIQGKTEKFNEDLRIAVDEIFDDPDLNEGQKINRAQTLIREKTAEQMTELEQRTNTEARTQSTDNAVVAAQLKPHQRFTAGIAESILEGISDGFPDPEKVKYAKEQAKLLVEPVLNEALDILNAPFTTEEKQNISQAWIDRNAKVEELKENVTYSAVVAAYNTQAEEQTQKEQPQDEEKKPNYVVNADLNLTTSDLSTPPKPTRSRTQGRTPDVIRSSALRKLNNKSEDLDSEIKKRQDQLIKLKAGNRSLGNLGFSDGRRRNERELRPLEDLEARFFRDNDYWFDLLTTRRVLKNGGAAISLEELREGVVEGAFAFDASLLTPETAAAMPILSYEMIASELRGEDTHDDAIKQYAEALNIDTSDENELSRFVTRQAKVFQDKLGIPFFTYKK